MESEEIRDFILSDLGELRQNVEDIIRDFVLVNMPGDSIDPVVSSITTLYHEFVYTAFEKHRMRIEVPRTECGISTPDLWSSADRDISNGSRADATPVNRKRRRAHPVVPTMAERPILPKPLPMPPRDLTSTSGFERVVTEPPQITPGAAVSAPSITDGPSFWLNNQVVEPGFLPTSPSTTHPDNIFDFIDVLLEGADSV